MEVVGDLSHPPQQLSHTATQHPWPSCPTTSTSCSWMMNNSVGLLSETCSGNATMQVGTAPSHVCGAEQQAGSTSAVMLLVPPCVPHPHFMCPKYDKHTCTCHQSACLCLQPTHASQHVGTSTLLPLGLMSPMCCGLHNHHLTPASLYSMFMCCRSLLHVLPVQSLWLTVGRKLWSSCADQHQEPSSSFSQ